MFLKNIHVKTIRLVLLLIVVIAIIYSLVPAKKPSLADALLQIFFH